MTLKEYRLSQKLTQRKAAEQIGVFPDVYSRWESGARRPCQKNLEKIADWCKEAVDPMALFKKSN